MNSDDIQWQLLARYVAGELSPGETADLKRWIAESSEREALVDEIRAVWRRTGELADVIDPVDIQAAWSRAAVRVAGRDAAPVEIRPLAKELRRRRSWPLVAAAAVGILAVGTLWWRREVLHHPGAVATRPAAEHTYATARGERGTVTLPDGTRLVLAPDSRLRLRNRLRGATREVELEGAAFFQVAYDSTHPFVVHSAGTVARVLGTEFSVTAYPGDPDVHVLVKSGKVGVHRGEFNGRRNAAVLTRGQLAHLGASGQATVVAGVDVDRTLAWTAGRLEFVRSTFGDVVPQVERWYDPHIMLADPALAARRLSASFQDETPDQVLASLALLINARAERSGSTVTFTPVRGSLLRGTDDARPAEVR